MEQNSWNCRYGSSKALLKKKSYACWIKPLFIHYWKNSLSFFKETQFWVLIKISAKKKEKTWKKKYIKRKIAEAHLVEGK
jgi:hypothetical protein